MSGLLPASVYGLRVPAGGIPIPAAADFPASFRITMAAIDPTAAPQLEGENQAIRATLKLIREPFGDDESDDDYDDDDIEAIKARLAGVISDDDEEMSDDEEDSENEKNGGPSDPAKSKKARKEAAIKALKEAIEAEEMELDDTPNGTKSKGKGKAVEGSDDESDSDEEDIDGEVEEFVLCTLDPEKNYQQTLDITVGEHETVYFASNGTHDIFLTGNYVLPPDDHDHSDDEDDYDAEEYDLSPDEDDIYDEDDEDEEDELDGLQNPRITEVDSDEEEAPKLVKAKADKKADKKAGKKRSAEEEAEASLDALIDQAKADMSKKQAKKLKKNDGDAAAAPSQEAKKDAKETNGEKKKVQFAKNLEQGPTGSPKVDGKKEAAKPATGPRNVQGVLIDDKKPGSGRAAKKGDRIEIRYIGKLKNGRQFDANKKGKPFSFKVGMGEVVKGMDIGVMGLTVGGERRITIPAKHGYGSQALPDIPANSDLIFDIKCLAIK